ncbi:MAG: YicC family protein [Gammaproteobacteria bacterium]|nr:YicC family protein [Gammaproteobacteria bacterium]MBU1624730.1 YicC family protein [Gammaproteobacteria bacterium]MBU1982574.1 YicC family protein [Gammaproteobacteria bacterium]
MIFSMTGYAVATAELDACSLSLELRSVNHRYLDLQLRMPDELRALEPMLREQISAKISRGKVECRINLLSRVSVQPDSRINPDIVKQLASWSDQVRDVFPAAGELTISEILKWHGMTESPSLSSDALHAAVAAALQQALQDFAAARQREGAKLASFLLERVESIEQLRLAVAPRIPGAIATYETKLRARLLEALGNEDDERVRQEITLYASKIDVDEELSRLHTHLAEVKRVIAKGSIAGKRLDFMMQELHREANTLGSKSVDAEVSRCAMDIKLLIEQMREQVQNIE